MKEVLAWLKASAQTSETKATLVAALWAGSARLIPTIPTNLPLDLSAAGLGVLTASPAMLVAYVLARVVVKALTDGQFPFQPVTPKETP